MKTNFVGLATLLLAWSSVGCREARPHRQSAVWRVMVGSLNEAICCFFCCFLCCCFFSSLGEVGGCFRMLWGLGDDFGGIRGFGGGFCSLH